MSLASLGLSLKTTRVRFDVNIHWVFRLGEQVFPDIGPDFGGVADGEEQSRRVEGQGMLGGEVEAGFIETQGSRVSS